MCPRPPSPSGGGEKVPKADEGLVRRGSKPAPHAAFGHPLPADAGRGTLEGCARDLLLPSGGGEKVPKADEGLVRRGSKPAPHAAFGHPLPALAGRGPLEGCARDLLLPSGGGEKVPKADEGSVSREGRTGKMPVLQWGWHSGCESAKRHLWPHSSFTVMISIPAPARFCGRSSCSTSPQAKPSVRERWRSADASTFPRPAFATSWPISKISGTCSSPTPPPAGFLRTAATASSSIT